MERISFSSNIAKFALSVSFNCCSENATFSRIEMGAVLWFIPITTIDILVVFIANFQEVDSLSGVNGIQEDFLLRLFIPFRLAAFFTTSCNVAGFIIGFKVET